MFTFLHDEPLCRLTFQTGHCGWCVGHNRMQNKKLWWNQNELGMKMANQISRWFTYWRYSAMGRATRSLSFGSWYTLKNNVTINQYLGLLEEYGKKIRFSCSYSEVWIEIFQIMGHVSSTSVVSWLKTSIIIGDLSFFGILYCSSNLL